MSCRSCERGWAMVELALTAAIVGILAALTVPKVNNMLDEVYVDYEIRGVHSLMHYTLSVGRICRFDGFGFGIQENYISNNIECFHRISGTEPNFYNVRRPDSGKLEVVHLKDDRYLERNFLISNNINDSHFVAKNDFTFVSGKDCTIVVSNGVVRRSLVLTNYGRMRISK